MQAYIPEELKAENNRLMLMVKDLDEDMTIEEFIEKNASLQGDYCELTEIVP